MSARVQDWQVRLHACVADRLNKPFTWGVQDCCMFAADCVEAVTGVDPAADLRGSYADAAGAARVLEFFGGVVSLAVERLGGVVRTELAQPGDVGLTMQDGRQTLAVCTGQHWHAPAALGLVALAPEQISRAWRCCRA